MTSLLSRANIFKLSQQGISKCLLLKMTHQSRANRIELRSEIQLRAVSLSHQQPSADSH